MHVASYIEGLLGELAKPSVKQHLAALRMLFEWLVVGQVVDVNPAHSVRGPKHVVKKGRTPVLDRDEARALLAAIGTGSLTGELHRMTQPEAYRMIQRHARPAGIKTKIGNHSMRATGITSYLENGGLREHAQAMAAHSFPWTTEPYDHRGDEITLDEYSRVGI